MPEKQRILFLLTSDWTWWANTVTSAALWTSIFGVRWALETAVGIAVLMAAIQIARDRNLMAFGVQLRISFALFLMACLIPALRWMTWIPALGTAALSIFGYCPMARMLALYPWNRTEPLTADFVKRVVFSPPREPQRPAGASAFDCAGAMCTIEAQVRTQSPAAG